MTSLFINENEVEVTPGTSILEACRQNGVDVPYFCYHPELSVAANCRMCLVEVEGWGKPAASCCTPVSEGMKVKTQTETLAKDREMIMEYLLIHHPLDCPVCDQGGSCKLQDYAVEHGASKGRYVEPKRAVVNYNLGPFVNTCMTRCIHCTRCVRFADEVAGTGDIGILNRSDHMTINGIVEEALSSELSGNLPDICPVGALLDKPSHDVSRPWEMTRHGSTCTQCPNGCDISIESRGDEVIRIRPVDGSPEPWICDRGRYVYDAFRSDNRILEPKVRIDGELQSADWGDAFDRTIDLLKDKRVGVVFSSQWSVEGLVAIRLMRDSLFPDAKVSFDLHRRDLRPFAFEEGLAMTTAQIEDADQVVILGSDLRQRLPLLMQRLRKRSRAGKPVSRIGAMNYRADMKISSDALIRPRDWPAVIARAMEQVSELGKTAAGFDAWVGAVSERHEAGKVLADALMGESCALLVGEEIRSHEDAAALIHGLDLLMRACGHAEAGNDGRNLIPEGVNAQVLSNVFADARSSAGEIFAAASAGELDALVLIGNDPVGDGLFPTAAKAALKKVPLVQIGSISGEMGEYAAVQLPAAAYSEIEGTFVNMEGRVRVASNPLKSLGQERPLWKVMMRLIQVMGGEVPVVSLDELRQAVCSRMSGLSDAWCEGGSEVFIAPARNKDATATPAERRDSFELDVVSRYSMYREGMWARASALLSEAGRINALDDVLVHPETLAAKGLAAGSLKVKTFLGEQLLNVGVREDVAPGVLFVAKRGVAGDLSDVTAASIAGGAV
ncbi:NADH dehydrogenase subunit G [Mariprofundus ferrinatatus]|uniref:NADH-quinone oxidoreductase n=1 Tax=Mariprofundus ferrinatatus TaxID=1921087 RepID=A0A2K8LCN7_9PROT|nr:NADH-quinone oxidoreductase subunit NuoG [Mariprofundus ferrinatatus]ATX82664.1 NADH dehydrogenase subunit G [Mariprofundus ferrinatatus]